MFIKSKNTIRFIKTVISIQSLYPKITPLTSSPLKLTFFYAFGQSEDKEKLLQ
jgi:hypothetical protein